MLILIRIHFIRNISMYICLLLDNQFLFEVIAISLVVLSFRAIDHNL